MLPTSTVMHRQIHRDCITSVSAGLDPVGRNFAERDVASEMTKRAGTAVSDSSLRYGTGLSDGLFAGDRVYPNSKQPDARIHSGSISSMTADDNRDRFEQDNEIQGQ